MIQYDIISVSALICHHFRWYFNYNGCIGGTYGKFDEILLKSHAVFATARQGSGVKECKARRGPLHFAMYNSAARYIAVQLPVRLRNSGLGEKIGPGKLLKRPSLQSGPTYFQLKFYFSKSYWDRFQTR